MSPKEKWLPPTLYIECFGEIKGRQVGGVKCACETNVVIEADLRAAAAAVKARERERERERETRKRPLFLYHVCCVTCIPGTT